MPGTEEEKMERGVEGGEARIKLYSKLKKIERRRFSVDVLARDREPDNVDTQDRFGTEEEEGKEEEREGGTGQERAGHRGVVTSQGESSRVEGIRRSRGRSRSRCPASETHSTHPYPQTTYR